MIAGAIGCASRAGRFRLAPYAAAAVLMLIGVPCFSSGGPAGTSISIEEVLVTARKIEENLFEVPGSVQVLSGERVGSANLSSLYTMQFEVPGLVVANLGMFGAGIALRGVTDEGGGSLSNAPHMNGAYLGDSRLALSRLFDVERVEVLKGPQGTLYGRNATGGSINVFTRVPDQDYSAAIEAALGSFDTFRASGHVNVPAESFAARVAFAAADGDGYIRNSVDGRTFAEQDYLAIRGSVRVGPADSLDLVVMAQHVEDDGATGDLWLPNRAFLADPEDIRLATVTLADPYLESTNDFASADLVYTLDTTTLRSISAYARNETRAVDDCAGLPVLQGCQRGLDPSVYEQWSQEFRLESSESENFDWVLGLYLFRADASERFYTIIPAFGARPVSDYRAKSTESAYAAFGQANYRFSERWSLTGGLRLNRDTRRVEDSGTGTTDNEALTTARGEWDNVSWRVDLQYTPRRGTLVYASVATGFKSGGITTEMLPDGSFDSYRPEELTAYEMGVKWRSADTRRSVLASAFVYDFRDLQVHTIDLIEDRVVSVIDNAAGARIHGVEVAASLRVDAPVTLSAGFVWLPKREFVDFANPVTGLDLSGNALSRAPEWAASAAVEYRLAVGDSAEFSARLDYNYRSDYFFTKENDPVSAQDAFGLLNLLLQIESNGAGWYGFVSGRNLLNADYFNQAFIQSSPGYPDTYEVGFGLRF